MLSLFKFESKRRRAQFGKQTRQEESGSLGGEYLHALVKSELTATAPGRELILLYRRSTAKVSSEEPYVIDVGSQGHWADGDRALGGWHKQRDIQ